MVLYWNNQRYPTVKFRSGQLRQTKLWSDRSLSPLSFKILWTSFGLVSTIKVNKTTLKDLTPLKFQYEYQKLTYLKENTFSRHTFWVSLLNVQGVARHYHLVKLTGHHRTWRSNTSEAVATGPFKDLWRFQLQLLRWINCWRWTVMEHKWNNLPRWVGKSLEKGCWDRHFWSPTNHKPKANTNPHVWSKVIFSWNTSSESRWTTQVIDHHLEACLHLILHGGDSKYSSWHRTPKK